MINKILIATWIILVGSGCASLTNSKEENAKLRRVAETNVSLAIGYIQQGHVEWAIEKLDKAVEADDDYAPVHATLAIAYEQLQKYDLADNHYREAIQLDPENGGAYNNYGVFLCKQGRYKQAEKYFLSAINTPRYKTPELAYENAGSCMRQLPNLEKAEDYLREALNRDPKLPLALYNMAEISYAKKNYLSTRAYLQRLSEVSKHNSRSLWIGIQTERILGDSNAAATYSKMLQSQFPKSKEFQMLINPNSGENKS